MTRREWAIAAIALMSIPAAARAVGPVTSVIDATTAGVFVAKRQIPDLVSALALLGLSTFLWSRAVAMGSRWFPANSEAPGRSALRPILTAGFAVAGLLLGASALSSFVAHLFDAQQPPIAAAGASFVAPGTLAALRRTSLIQAAMSAVVVAAGLRLFMQARRIADGVAARANLNDAAS